MITTSNKLAHTAYMTEIDSSVPVSQCCTPAKFKVTWHKKPSSQISKIWPPNL